MKVLVVDDNKDMIAVIQMMIENKNHRVITANDGENGYSAYLQFKPDLVLTDIQMPGKDGFELIHDNHFLTDPFLPLVASGFHDYVCHPPLASQ